MSASRRELALLYSLLNFRIGLKKLSCCPGGQLAVKRCQRTSNAELGCKTRAGCSTTNTISVVSEETIEGVPNDEAAAMRASARGVYAIWWRGMRIVKAACC
jgi:hypothetical protein